MSLGFRQVAAETSDQILEVTQDAFKELGQVRSLSHDETDFVQENLSKLSLCMSDRAANEKKADRLIQKWKDDAVGTGRGEVHSFSCMAHVLLGFHSYTIKALKEQENTLDYKIGREALPEFAYWKESGTAASRTIRMSSEVFGPEGDHLGMRDKWEGYCAVHAVKSHITSYRDNRFNGLFKGAAEVIYHSEEFLKILAGANNSKNRKLQSLEADLKCPFVNTMILVLALFYFRITDPFWTLITSTTVKYLELAHYIQPLHSHLQNIFHDPNFLQQGHELWEDVTASPEAVLLSSRMHQPEDSGLYKSTVKLVAQAFIQTIEKQLVDFLPDGKFGKTNLIDPSEFQRTGFSLLTNLPCEHHFGSLDSSMRRRPNASLHHHSSLHLLRQNKKGMLQWLNSMSHHHRLKVFSECRREAPLLRNQNRNREKQVRQQMGQPVSEYSERRKAATLVEDFQEDGKCLEKETETLSQQLPKKFLFKTGQYVAVAYQDAWYPGMNSNIAAL